MARAAKTAPGGTLPAVSGERLGANKRLQAAVLISHLRGEEALPVAMAARANSLRADAVRLIESDLRRRGIPIGGSVQIAHELAIHGEKANTYRLRRLALASGTSDVLVVLSRLRANDGVPSVREATWPIDALARKS